MQMQGNKFIKQKKPTTSIYNSFALPLSITRNTKDCQMMLYKWKFITKPTKSTSISTHDDLELPRGEWKGNGGKLMRLFSPCTGLVTICVMLRIVRFIFSRGVLLSVKARLTCLLNLQDHLLNKHIKFSDTTKSATSTNLHYISWQ